MTHKVILLFVFIINTIVVFAQGPAFGIESRATCMILKDTTFTTIDDMSEVTTTIDYVNGDDGSYISNPIMLPFSFSFFGQTFNSVYLNINGNITFDNPYDEYNTTSFKTFNRKMIAPFWADIDLVLPNESSSPKGKIHFKVNPTNFIVIWEDVGYYENKSDKLNTFQLVITNGNDPLIPNGGNVAFYYDKMSWTSGHASLTDNGFCGYPATVGITNGDSSNYFQIGRFDHLGDSTDYDGEYDDTRIITPIGCNAANGTKYFDGVKWLEKRCDLVYNISKQMIIQPTACILPTNNYNLNLTYFIVNFPSSGTLKIKVDGIVKKTYNLPTELPTTGPFFIGITDLASDGAMHTVTTEFSGNPSRNLSQTYKAPVKCVINNCAECVTSFSPMPGKEYILSAWVKESYTGNSPLGYTHSGIRITFNNGADQTLPLFRPTGPVVDGWQRIEAAFMVPENAANIQIVLVNEATASGANVFFDDIRIHPYNSNMKSFVYDPSTQKLTAELDENNFSTQYEYDDEGILIRVKKETERGVMTIKETRSNQSKIK